MTVLYAYHPGWIFLAVVLALAYTFFMYYKEKVLSDVKSSLKWILSGLRFTGTFLITLLLIGIIFEHYKTRTEKPLLFIAQDNSESIVQTKDSTFYRSTYFDSLTDLKSKLKEKFDIIEYSFSDIVKQGIDSSYDEKITDISNVLNQIYDQYNNRNIGGIVLSSDGIYNQGMNPIYTVSRKSNVPVFSIGLGDTTKLKDVLINEILHNEVAFLGNQFPVTISVNQDGFKGQEIVLEILEKGKVLFTKKIKFTETDQLIKVPAVLTANKTGYRTYTARISESTGEYTLKNNLSNFYINVIDGRQKILLAYSGVHPDVSALNYVIENNKNYELTVSIIEEIDENVEKYDLVIVHNYQKGNSQIDELIKTNQKPVLHIIGVNCNLKSLLEANIGFKGQAEGTEDVTFLGNGNFNEIMYSPEIIKQFEQAPPLKSPMGNLNFSQGIKTLAFQKIGSIGLTKPLIYFNEKNENKYAVIFGEGIWRWRLFDQMQNQTTSNFENLVSKIINYLAVKENKDPFKVEFKNEYAENEKITIRAELYNASYDLINTPEVDFKLINTESKVLSYHFYKTLNAYKLDLGSLEAGIYQWEATTNFNGKNYQKTGTFLVREVKRELLNLSADHRLLRNISENTNGQFFEAKELFGLTKALLNREDIVPISYQEKQFDDFIDYKWVFFLIILLLLTEWFVRKFLGGY